MGEEMKLGREFLRYVLPSMLAFALSGIYSIADGFFVGNRLGDSALTAINVAYPLTAFIQAAGTGIGMGGAILFTLAANSAAPEAKNRYFGYSHWDIADWRGREYIRPDILKLYVDIADDLRKRGF